MKQSVSNYDFLSFLILLKYMQINVPLSMILSSSNFEKTCTFIFLSLQKMKTREILLMAELHS